MITSGPCQGNFPGEQISCSASPGKDAGVARSSLIRALAQVGDRSVSRPDAIERSQRIQDVPIPQPVLVLSGDEPRGDGSSGQQVFVPTKGVELAGVLLGDQGSSFT